MRSANTGKERKAWTLALGALLRFFVLLGVKWLSRLCYRFETQVIAEANEQTAGKVKDAARWQGIRLAILLNHTSLMEPVFAGVLPPSYLWQLAKNGVFPGAEETLARPVIGRIIKCLAPRVIPLSRRRDATWADFLAALKPTDTLIFLPEGRMKRPTGLDKHGKPMTVKSGIAEVLTTLKTGPMVLCYSGGLHHVQTPGEGLPKLFQKVKINFAFTRIEDYLQLFVGAEDLKDAISKDLEKRRDRYCPGGE